MSVQNINTLSDECINQIAAGEVIERPSSVVKELVENSIDAGAHDIEIVIEDGGKRLIRITDNGKGIAPEDIPLCFQRHTTSKIKNAEDLTNIQTNGFRGEALSSIAAVARVELESSYEENPEAVRLTIEGGKVLKRESAARNQGTTFVVRDLFFNTPVREKFLASAQTESNRIQDFITRFALAHPEIRFTLRSGVKLQFDCVPGTQENRIAEIFGAKMSRHFIPVENHDGFMGVFGVISPPEQSKGRRSQQYFFLNRRPVWNPLLSKAVSRAYENLAPGRHPVAVLFLELPAASFDVNVHPAKREVRFTRENQVFSSIVHALRESLHKLENTPRFEVLKPDVKLSPKVDVNTSLNQEKSYPDFSAQNSAPKQTSFATFSHNSNPSKEQEDSAPIGEEQDLFAAGLGNVIQLSPRHYKENEEPKPVDGSIRYYQLAGQYILCEDHESMILIHQRAAHQRILYEDALEKLESKSEPLDSQQLLFPEVIEFTPAESSLLEEHQPMLKQLAWDLEFFGGYSWRLTGIPLDFSPSLAEEAVRNLLHDYAEEKQGDSPEEAMAKAFCKHTAIAEITPLDAEKMGWIMDNLFATDSPFVSPFGRPTVLRFPLEDIHRRFRQKKLKKDTFAP